MIKKLRLAIGTLLASASLLSGCAVYVPTVPATPLLRTKGEAEITAAIRNLSSLEATAAWSPAPHLLLTGEAALRTSSGSETANNVTTNFRNSHRQASLGLGTYRLLGATQATYLGLLGGVGTASVDQYSSHVEDYFILPVPSPVVRYQSTYRRYHGQAYVARQRDWGSYGLSARGTVVHYRQLLRAGVPIASPTQFYLEPTLFVRVGRRAVQGLATLGLSTPLGARGHDAESGLLAPVTSLLSAGVVLRPHLLRRRAAAAE